MTKTKNYWAAILLAIFVGGLGIHEFYLGRNTYGVLELLFCWTYIPALIALVEAIIWIFGGEEEFNNKFNKPSDPTALNS